MHADRAVAVLRRRALGLLLVALVLGGFAFSVAVYERVFTRSVHVLLRTDHVGNQLQTDSDVKVLGIVVGRVSEVRSRDGGAELDLALVPEAVADVPADVSARLLPKTLFGERYVSLVVPDAPSSAHLRSGDVIDQDRTSGAIELERVLADLMPTLRAVRPQQLAVTLTSVADALRGRGEALGDALVELDALLRELNPHLPALTEDISRFADVTGVHADAAPDLARALDDLAVTSTTISERRDDLLAVHRGVASASHDLDGFLRDTGNDLIRLSAASQPVLDVLAAYAPEYPCLLDAVDALRPRVDRALGRGTDRPGLHVTLTVVPARAPGDGPVAPSSGPRCPSPPSGGGTAPSGVAGSPEEGRLIAALAAPGLGLSPQEVPSWSGLLLGPLYRGTEVVAW
ncbi:MCE family protein [Umezawaea beigongshangensis]|uniref:MCE family protein n=1 Tax=Umezawaea beigongshangensis TaxID=2780383 RepID=UPI0018F2344B|nr:MCE family protein [Umezawaea beigongshangensis]